MQVPYQLYVHMKNPRLQLPPPEESEQGARLSMQNAHRHAACAELLAAKEFYENAVAHLVLAVEEAAKSLYLWFHSVGVNLSKGGLQQALRNHKVRLDIASTALLFAWMRPLHIAKFLHIGPVSENDLQRIVADYSVSNEDIAWLKSANNRKQLGLYVDYGDEKWRTPTELTQADYDQAKPLVDRILKDISWGT